MSLAHISFMTISFIFFCLTFFFAGVLFEVLRAGHLKGLTLRVSVSISVDWSVSVDWMTWWCRDLVIEILSVSGWDDALKAAMVWECIWLSHSWTSLIKSLRVDLTSAELVIDECWGKTWDLESLRLIFMSSLSSSEVESESEEWGDDEGSSWVVCWLIAIVRAAHSLHLFWSTCWSICFWCCESGSQMCSVIWRDIIRQMSWTTDGGLIRWRWYIEQRFDRVSVRWGSYWNLTSVLQLIVKSWRTTASNELKYTEQVI